MPIRLIVGLIVSITVMGIAHAEEITPWNFRGQIPVTGNVVQLTSAHSTPQGLAIITQQDGYIVWGERPVPGPTDVVTIIAHARTETPGQLLWRLPGGTANELVQLPFTIPGGGLSQSVDAIVAGYPEWDWHTEQLALAFPAGTDVVIEEIQFRHWPLYERVGEWWKSFWTFDVFRPYSINFLWGPLVTSNTPGRLMMFDTLPPRAWAIGRIVYPLLIVGALIAWFIGWQPWRRAKAWGWWLTLFMSIWLIFDIRMGAEILSYAVDDLRSYVYADPADKQLRNFAQIHTNLYAMLPELKKHDRFVLLSLVSEVYTPLTRYEAYPSRMITDPKEQSGATVWVVLDRSDVWVDEQSRLRMGENPATAQILTPPGRVVVPVRTSSFLFVTP